MLLLMSRIKKTSTTMPADCMQIATQTAALVQANHVPLAVATFVQFTLCWLLYGVVLAAPYARNLAKLHGVKHVEQIKMRHAMWVCMLYNNFVHAVRAFVIIAILSVQKDTSLCMYLTIATFVGLFEIIASTDGKLWAQNPCALICVSCVSQLTVAAGAGASLFLANQ
jgi:hypothetical protein